MRKIIPVVAAGATALALAGGTFGYATLQKDVTLSVDGATTEVSSMSSTVGDVLDSQGITVGEHDVVAPAVDAKVADGSRIAVQYGRQVKVKVDGKPQTLWTTATRVDQALASLDVNTTGAALSTSRSSAIGREGLALDVATMKTVTLDAAGKKQQVRTTARTVADVLKAAKITVDRDDKLSVR
ncbi:MAG TPA: ubiquitin-like domain-containing protein, partial [Propionibacteriaceae bacterium]